jgi:hypothetical protein
MPQNANAATIAKNPSNAQTTLTADASQSLYVTDGATSATYNVTAATVIKATAGRVFSVSVVVAGSAAGSLYNAATTGSVAASNKIADVPNTLGVISPAGGWPCATGIVVVPGTGQTVAISFR